MSFGGGGGQQNAYQQLLLQQQLKEQQDAKTAAETQIAQQKEISRNAQINSVQNDVSSDFANILRMFGQQNTLIGSGFKGSLSPVRGAGLSTGGLA